MLTLSFLTDVLLDSSLFEFLLDPQLHRSQLAWFYLTNNVRLWNWDLLRADFLSFSDLRTDMDEISSLNPTSFATDRLS